MNDRDKTSIDHLKKDILVRCLALCYCKSSHFILQLRWSALKPFGSGGDNEAKRNIFVSPFLISVINSFNEPALKLCPQRRIDGSIEKGPVDYTIEYNGKVIYVTECKATEFVQGISQNLAQLNRAAEVRTPVFAVSLTSAKLCQGKYSETETA